MRAGRDPALSWPEEPRLGTLSAYFTLTVLGFALPIAVLGDHTFALGRIDAADRALVLLGLVLGPLTGWLLGGSSLTTEWYCCVNAMTAFTGWPLVAAACARSRAAMTFAAPLWVLGGYFFTIATWV